MHDHKSSFGLIGAHIDAQTGQWTQTETSVGGWIDSFYEYLLKSSIAFDDAEASAMFYSVLYDSLYSFRQMYGDALKHLRNPSTGWMGFGTMNHGTFETRRASSLAAFWPGIEVLVGDLDLAVELWMNYYNILRKMPFMPEFFDILRNDYFQTGKAYLLLSRCLLNCVGIF